MNSFYLQPDQDLPHTPSKIPQVPPAHLNVHLNEHTNSARFHSQSEKKRYFVYYNKGHHRKAHHFDESQNLELFHRLQIQQPYKAPSK